MRRELTRRHSILFEKKGTRNLFSLVNDINQYQKWSELVSFMVWEFSHRLGLFAEKNYLKFNDREGISLENEVLTGSDFNEKLVDLFKTRGMIASRSDIDWKLLFIKNDGEMIGCLYSDDKAVYRSTDQGATAVHIQSFPEQIKSIFVSSQNTIFVCVKGAVYKSSDRGASFEKTLYLSTPESFFRHNNAMTETPDQTLLIGEYGNVWEKRSWRKLAYLYSSSDGGASWERSDFLITKGINKHVHLVKYSRLLDRVLMADGDNQKKLWVSQPMNSSVPSSPNGWKPVNKFHIQMGGYTSIVESDGKILFGTDYQGGTNFLVETTDGVKFTKRIVPDPYRRSPIDNMVLRKSRKGQEIWANLPYSTANSKCLLMYTDDDGESWNKFIEYNRATHKAWILSSSNEASDVIYISVENTKDKNRVVYKIADE